MPEPRSQGAMLRRAMRSTGAGTALAVVAILGAFAVVWLLREGLFPNGAPGFILVATLLVLGTGAVARRLGAGTGLLAGQLFVANLLLFLALHPGPYWKDSLRSLDDFGMVRWGWMPATALLAALVAGASLLGARRARTAPGTEAATQVGAATLGVLAAAVVAVVVLVGAEWLDAVLESSAGRIVAGLAFFIVTVLLALTALHVHLGPVKSALLGLALGAFLMLFANEMPPPAGDLEDEDAGYPLSLLGPAIFYGLIVLLGPVASLLAWLWGRSSSPAGSEDAPVVRE